MKIERGGHSAPAVKAARPAAAREAFGREIWQAIAAVIGLRVRCLENWWALPLLVTAGGALVGLVHTGEHVCRLCLEAARHSLVFSTHLLSLGAGFF